MYTDFKKRRMFAAGKQDREREYWIDKLSGDLVKTSFPSDVIIQGAVVRKMEMLGFQLPLSLFRRLMEIINNSDSRLHIALVTGLTILLYKYTGNNDIIIGTPIDKQEVEGEFINTILPLRNTIDEQISVKEFLIQVKQTKIEANNNQNYPIETIPYELGMSMAEGEFPLFDTAVLLENIQDKKYIQHINLSMIFSFLRTENSLNGIIEYNASIYEKKTVERVVSHFLYLMQEAFFNVNLKLVDVPVLSEEEKNWLVRDCNETSVNYPRDKMIHQLFEEQVEQTPGNIAAESKDELYTYKELNERINRFARVLREKGIVNDSVVAIILESSAEVPLAIMSVLKAGGTYLPIGFEYPGERINYLLKDSGAKLLITRKSLVEGKTIESPIIDVEDETFAEGDCENVNPINRPDSLAYIIYTSGTTGQPKGVMVEHKGLVNYIWWAAQMYVKGEKLDFPLYTSISFDLTVTSIFTPLITGNGIIVYGGIDKKLYIEDVIDDNRVGIVKLTPSHLKLIWAKKVKNSSIKRLIVGGEELETQLARDIYNNFGNKIEIYNEYGPTETAVGSMIYRFDPVRDTRHSIPIGEPIANTRIYLLNKYFQPVPPGVEGEIYIGGDGLSRGYLFNPKMTEEKFVSDPLIDGQKMYKTGDLAVRLPDGNIEYKGRIDHQIKIRGYRVETGEIEAKIVEFQKMARAGREHKENIVEKMDLKSLKYCKTCLIPVNYPGGIHFDEQGICDICREFETYKGKAFAYFKTVDDFHKVVAQAQKSKRSKYDCLMLYSGGKDSSYVMHRLVEMGLKVLAFTFDNGYISGKAFENIDRTTKLLNVEHIMLNSKAMKEIFVESLWSDYNVCNGCFKAVNTLGTKVAHDNDINLVISGLTRGQIFDIKLHGLLKLGVFEEETIEERLKLFRKNYHSMTHRTSRLIGVEILDESLDNTYFVDFFRYDNIPTSKIFEYLKEKDSGWVRPTDTGASSSNCIINDVGIYVHLKDKGCHFYAPQLSWDCRFGTITREEGLEEMWGYGVDYAETRRVLNEIGYYNAFTGAVVTNQKDEKGDETLCAYILADKEFDVSELKAYLSRQLPDYMIPTYYTRLDSIPLASSGKVDRKALPKPELSLGDEYVAPRNSVEDKLAQVWSDVLGLKKEKIGINANFFEVGGHSLRATFLAAAVQKYFSVKLPLVKIFELPTIRGQAELIKGAIKEIFASISSVEEKEYYALSSAQRRLYILQQMDLNSTAYNVPLVVLLEGELNYKKLAETFKRLFDRHETLRTSLMIVEDTPVQKVLREIESEIQYYEASQVDGIIKNFIQPFDLSKAPLMRVGLIKTGPFRYALLVDMHHIVTDGISQGILINDFIALYNDIRLPSLRLQYRDYSVWQQNHETQNALLKQEEFWLNEFQGELTVLNIPTDYSRPPVQSFEGISTGFEIDEVETAALNEIARLANATLFMVLLATFNIFLSKISAQGNIVVGTPIAGRRHADLEFIVGNFVNTLAINAYPNGGKTFKEFLNEIRELTINAFENQDYPFEDLVEKITVQRDISRNPIFDAMFILQNMFDPSRSISEREMADLRIKPYSFENRTVKFDLSLTSTEKDGKLYFSIGYCTKLFREETIEKMIGYFKRILTYIISNTHKKLADIEIIPEEIKHKMLSHFNENLHETIAIHPIQAILSDSFQKYRNNTAIESGLVRLTYAELEHRAACIAQLLAKNNIEKESFIGIYFEDRIQIISAIIGVLRRGCLFVPLDTALPGKRVENMIRLTDMQAILTDAVHEAILTGMKDKGPENMRIFVFDDLFYQTCQVDENRNSDITYEPGDKIYVYFTSGTTGLPNGIVGKNKSLVQFLQWEIETFAVDETYRISQLTAVGFDAFLRDVFVPLLAGGTICIPGSADILLKNNALIDWLDRNRINLVHCVPSLFRIINSEQLTSASFSHLKYVLLSGEPIKPNELRSWYRIFGNRIQLVNYYGPTETTMIKTYHLINMSDIETGNIPAGHPISGTRIIILDKHMKICHRGIMGEIYIRTAYGTYGYLDNPVLNAGCFIKNPFNKNTGDTIYKTGDLGRELENGEIEVLGRVDRQVKIRGVRIELENIENCLLKHGKIEKAILVNRKDTNGDNYLCAYIVYKKQVFLDSGTAPSASELREHLAGELPEYMIPSYFVPIETVPLTSNGKIDTKALPDHEIKIDGGYIAPRNAIEEKLRKLWSEVLGIQKDVIGIDSNFFDLGGHSLKAMALLSKIHRELNASILLVEMFKVPTLRGLAEYISSIEKKQFKPIYAVEKKEYYDLSSAQKRLYLVQQMDIKSTAYNMPKMYISGQDPDKERLKKTFMKLVERHESLRTTFEIVNGQPVQHVRDYVELEIEYSDLAFGMHVQTQIIKNFVRAFDLSMAPLMRIGLIKTVENKHILMVDMHHIISDGVSHTVLVRDFIALYSGGELPVLKLHYKDFTEWRNKLSESPEMEKQEKYWLEEFAGELPKITIPTDYIRPVVQNFEGDSVYFEINVEETQLLKELVKKENVTLFMVLLAIYNVLLSKLTSQEDIIIGTGIAGRRHPDLEKIIGIFVNTLAMRNYPVEKKTFKGFLREVRDRTLQAFENQDYLFEDLVEKVVKKRDLNRNPLFDTVLMAQNIEDDSTETSIIEKSTLTLIPYSHGSNIAKFDMFWGFMEASQGLQFSVTYRTKLFERETIQRYIAYFKKIVSEVTGNYEIKIRDILNSFHLLRSQSYDDDMELGF